MNDPSAGRAGLPVRRVQMSQLVAYNLAYFRRAAGLGQQEAGERIGWSAASVSAAERSWESRRVKKFDADELVRIAIALGVPVLALLLPPEDNGTAVRYVLDPPLPGEAGSELSAVVPYLGLDYGDESASAAMDAYRQRLIAAGIGPLGRSLDLAARVLSLAQQSADAAITGAWNDSDQTLIRARDEAEHVLQLARRQAEQLTGDAQARAAALERDAQERHRQAMGELIMQREELERRVDDLRVFESEYRSRLQALLEGQYRELWAGVEGIDADELVEAMRRRADERGAGKVTAILLGEDGTYDVLQSDQVAEIVEEAREQGSTEDTGGSDEPAPGNPRDAGGTGG